MHAAAAYAVTDTETRSILAAPATALVAPPTSGASAVDPDGDQFSEAGLTIALIGVVVVMLLGVGLLVHRAGRRGRRGH